MPYYTSTCKLCNTYHDFVSKIDDRDNTPICCNTATERILVAPMVGAMGLADHAAFRSPIDGTMVYGKSGLDAHMKKHGVVHESDMKGEAQHQRKQADAADAKQRTETINKTLSQLGA